MTKSGASPPASIAQGSPVLATIPLPLAVSIATPRAAVVSVARRPRDMMVVAMGWCSALILAAAALLFLPRRPAFLSSVLVCPALPVIVAMLFAPAAITWVGGRRLPVRGGSTLAKGALVLNPSWTTWTEGTRARSNHKPYSRRRDFLLTKGSHPETAPAAFLSAYLSHPSAAEERTAHRLWGASGVESKTFVLPQGGRGVPSRASKGSTPNSSSSSLSRMSLR